jgi:iron complex outermembrane receptor protein
VGYRAQPSSDVTISVSAFLTDLDDLRGGRLAPSGAAFVIANAVVGRTMGLEAWALWQANPRWRLMAGWLELHQDLHDKDGSGNLSGPSALGNDPRHTVKARSSWHLSEALDLDIDWRYVSSLAYLMTVPAYNTTDLHVAWRMTRNIELALAVNNVFDRRHVEFDEHGFPSEIPRSAYGQLRLYF